MKTILSTLTRNALADSISQDGQRLKADPPMKQTGVHRAANLLAACLGLMAASPAAADSYTIALEGNTSNFYLIANQLDNGGNTLSEILPNVSSGTALQRFDPISQRYSDIVLYIGGGLWVSSDGSVSSGPKLEPGEGAFLISNDSGQLVFTGTRRTSPKPLALVKGCQIVSLQVPEVGNYESIVQRAPVEGAEVQRWVPEAQNWDAYVFTNAIWHVYPSAPINAPDPSWRNLTNAAWQHNVPPTARVGEAWFLCLPGTNAPPITNCLSLVCAPDITTTNQPGFCSAQVNIPLPAATNSCGAPPSVTSARSDGHALIDPYPVGATTIHWTATDSSGVSTSCTQRVTVLDREAPTIICPKDLVLDAGPGRCPIHIGIGQPTALDNCDGAISNHNDGVLFFTRHASPDCDTLGTNNVRRVSFRYSGGGVMLGTPTALADVPLADGILIAPDGDLLVGGGTNGLLKINPSNGSVQTASVPGGAAFHLTLDPSGTRIWATGVPGTLVSFPLNPLGNGTVHTLSGDDTNLTSLCFDDAGHAYYAAKASTGDGNIGTIDLITYHTLRQLGNVFATQGLLFDPFTGHLLLLSQTDVMQVDPANFATVSLQIVAEADFDQGAVNGSGQLYLADATGHLYFLDYSTTGLVGEPGAVAALVPLETCAGAVAPLVGLGAASELQIVGTRNDGLPLGEAYPEGVTTITWRATDQAGNTGICTQTVTVICRSCLKVPLNLIAWWTGDEYGGLLVRDIARASSANDGVLIGGVGRAAGHVAGALQFDGATGYLEVANDREVNLIENPFFTIDAWINPASIEGFRPILDKREAAPRGFSLFLENGKLGFQMADGTSSESYVALAGPTLVKGAWTHVAVTVNQTNGTGALFINGVSVHTFVPKTGPYANSAPLWIGRGHNFSGSADTYFQGLIDELAFTISSAPADDVTAIYNAGLAGRCKQACHTAWEAPTRSPGTTTVDFTLCNYAPVDYSYAWSIVPSSCEALSPTRFVTNSGTLFVPAVTCVSELILAETPPNSPNGHGCYTIFFTNLVTGDILECPGSTFVFNPFSVVPRVPITTILDRTTSNVVFDVKNWNTIQATFSYEFAAMPSDMNGMEMTVMIDGNPPGAHVPGEITLPPLGQGAITARVAFAFWEPFRFHDLLVWSEVNGSNQPVASTALSATRPPAPPRLMLSLASCAGDLIHLVYSKPVQLDGHYTLDQGGVITSVEHGTSESDVVLRTQTLTPGLNYMLTAEEVHDQEVLPNALAPNPTVSMVRPSSLATMPAHLSLRRVGPLADQMVAIEWSAPDCVLQSTTVWHSDPGDNVWTDLPEARSPYLVHAVEPARFFRLACNPGCITAPNSALSFDGNDLVAIPDAPSLNPTTAITVECRVNFGRLASGPETNGTNAQVIVAKGGDTAGRFRIYQNRPGTLNQLWFSIGPEGSAVYAGYTGQLQTNRWYHLAGSYDGTTIKFYLDGKRVALIEVPRVPIGNSSPLYFGYNDVAGLPYQLTGQLEEVRLWNYARSEVQITANRNARLTGTEPGLVGYWTFDEATGEQRVFDQAIYSNLGVLGSSIAPAPDDPQRVPGP